MNRRDIRYSRLLLLILGVLLDSVGNPASSQAQVIEGDGWSLHKVPSRTASNFGGGNPYDGDTYSFAHQTGAFIDGQFQCFSEHGSGMTDNTVLFDGLTEFLDPYLDGTQPALLEFEVTVVSSAGPSSQEITFNSFLDSGTDLFPEGFEDPETGTPLTDACVEIGIDDTLDPDQPTSVTSATLQFFGGSPIGPVDITSFFSDPWDGRLSIVFTDVAGLDTTGVVLELMIEESSPPIFADGFESGDTSSWTDQVP